MNMFENNPYAERSRDKPMVLIVDDEYRALLSLSRLISPKDFYPTWAPNAHEGLRLLRKKSDSVRAIIVDLKSSGMGGGGFLNQARQIAPKAAVLVTTPMGPFLYKKGDFYEFSGPTLKKEINRILGEIVGPGDSHGPNGDTSQPQAKRKERFGPIIGKSKSINEIYRLIDRLRESAVTVLIQGESGTGKELLAKTIHLNSPRKGRPFIAINCGAIPATLIESELFGHEKGAFTSAHTLRKGKFEIADGGSLFLDEIGELDRDLQVKLLRVLQEKEFERVGGNRTIKSDVRIIAASNHNLKDAVDAAHFREDLYYRLNVMPVTIPPLRERVEDIPLLLNHFFQQIARELGAPRPAVSKNAMEVMVNYPYPGNIRELANIVQRLLLTNGNGYLTSRDLPPEMTGHDENSLHEKRSVPENGVTLKEVERRHILSTLEKTGGNKSEAAKMLGITRRLLYLRLAEYGEQVDS